MITVDSLRQAIAAHLGKELTPEVAAAIEQAAIDRTDRAIDPGQFASLEVRGLSFQVERFEQVLPELLPLHEAHFAETEKHLDGFALRPNYDYMTERERTGSLLQFTARDTKTGTLVGNIRMYLAYSMHTGTLVATEDTFYLLPAYRRGMAAIRFWQYMERAVVDVLGAREICTDSKTVNKVHRLNEYLGYRHVANKYVKTFPEREACHV